MKKYLLACKSCFRSVSFLSILLLTVVAVFLLGRYDLAANEPHAGVCDLSGSEEGARVTATLLENGCIRFEDPVEMERLVGSGRLDCCLILPTDLADRLKSGDLAESVRFVQSPSSYMPDVYRNFAAAALFRERAPYIAADAFVGTEVGADEVLQAYFSMYEDGYAFAFDVVTQSGTAVSENGKAQSMLYGAISVLVLVLTLSSASQVLNRTFYEVSRRIGYRSGVRTVLIPNMLVRAFLISVALSLSLLLAGVREGREYCLHLIPSVLIYVLLLCGFGFLVAAILPRREHMLILLPILVTASLALCPIYSDLALLSPALAVVRNVLPSYWLWLIGDSFILWTAVALLIVALAIGALTVRFCVLGKYRLTPNKK